MRNQAFTPKRLLWLMALPSLAPTSDASVMAAETLLPSFVRFIHGDAGVISTDDMTAETEKVGAVAAAKQIKNRTEKGTLPYHSTHRTCIADSSRMMANRSWQSIETREP